MTNAGQPPLKAAVYCRLSRAIDGSTEKVEDQERICRGLAGQRGWEVTEVYSDNSLSAWQKNRRRPRWDAMLAAVEAGQVQALVVYHGDRLIRHPKDLETLIDLADSRGIKLAAPTGTRDIDNDDDRTMMRVEAAFAWRESANTSRRKKAGFERLRRKGLVRSGGRGGRAFGFSTDGVTHIPAECAAVRDAARRILAGESAGAVAAALNEAGFTTAAGGPFTHATVRKMLARSRYAGLMPDGENKAAWEPVLEREVWESVCAVLEAKAAGYGYASNAHRWLLSGLAKCGACGSGLQVRYEHRRTHQTGYGCVKPGCRKVQRSQKLLDEYVITRVLGKLGDTRSPPGRLPSGGAAQGEFRALATQRQEIEAMLADHTRGRADLLMKRLDSIDSRLSQLRGQVMSTAAAQLLAGHAGITRAQFSALPLGTKRALVNACFTITVLPATKRGPGFRTEDVALAPAGA